MTLSPTISFLYRLHVSQRGPNCALLCLWWHGAVNAKVASTDNAFLHANIVTDCPSLQSLEKSGTLLF